jgi:hemoglobin
MNNQSDVKTDILGEEEIVKIVHAFYERVELDEKLGPIFNEVVKINWASHLPVMVKFWRTIMFGDGDYRGNPLMAHMKWAKDVKMNENKFQHWLALFHSTIDDLYSGPNAEMMKMRSANMASVLPKRIQEFQNLS